MKPAVPLSNGELFRYLEREITLVRASEIEAEVARNPDAGERLEQLRGLLTELRAPRPELRQADLVGAVHAAFDGRHRRDRPLARWRWWIAGSVGLAIAASGLLLFSLDRTGQDREFRARSGGDPTQAASRWAGIQVFRAPPGTSPTRVGRSLKPREGLVFAYTNAGPAPFAFLMIFAVDPAGHIFWFYPPYETQGEDPEATPIGSQSGFAQLPDRITHELPVGALAIYGVFTHQRSRVSALEAAVGRAVHDGSSPLTAARLQCGDCAVQVIPVLVEP